MHIRFSKELSEIDFNWQSGKCQNRYNFSGPESRILAEIDHLTSNHIWEQVKTHQSHNSVRKDYFFCPKCP